MAEGGQVVVPANSEVVAAEPGARLGGPRA